MTVKYPRNIAYLGVDLQKTFCPGGGLPVEGGHEIMETNNQLREKTELGYWTQDWHPEGHSSFASTHGLEPFTVVDMLDGEIVPEGTEGAIKQMLWPDHGVQGWEETELHPALRVPEGDLIVRKGDNPKIDSYSCVWENDKKTRPRFENGKSLPEQAREDGVDTFIIGGLALDVCVADGAIDLKKEGFRVIVVLDACAAISPEGQAAALKRFAEAGVEVVMSDQLDAYLGFNQPAVAPKGPRP